jgi:hypothetical protein
VRAARERESRDLRRAAHARREQLLTVAVHRDERLPPARVEHPGHAAAAHRLGERAKRADADQLRSVRQRDPVRAGQSDSKPGVAAGPDADGDLTDLRPADPRRFEQLHDKREQSLCVRRAIARRHVIARLAQPAVGARQRNGGR